MAGERRLRVLTRLLGTGSVELEPSRLCEVGAEVTCTSGAGIMLMSSGAPQGSVCTSNAVSAHLEQLQFSLVEGPCIDAWRQDRPVLEPDLAMPAQPRWLAFAESAVQSGALAVFAFPLQVGAIRLGALSLYCARAGPLSDEQHADALVVASVAAQAILVMQAAAPPGKLAAELEAGADFHFAVHQASGMVAAQLDISVGQALVRLRAYAFGNEHPLVDVAHDVVARRLRFDLASGERDDAP